MKTNILTAIAAALLFVTVSCQKDYEINTKEDGMVFTATIGKDSGTKTTLGNDYNVTWNDDDAIIVNDYYNCGISDISGSTATFSTKASTSAPYTAFYPPEINENGTMCLPDVQTFTNGFCKAPMYAYNETGTDLYFYNICAILAIKVLPTQMSNVKSIRVSSSDKAMCGEFSVDKSGEQPYAVLSSPDDFSRAVVLNCSEIVSVEEEGSTFYVAIPAGSYSSLKIQISSDGIYYTSQMTTQNPATVEANKVYNITFSSSPASSDTYNEDQKTIGSDEKQDGVYKTAWWGAFSQSFYCGVNTTRTFTFKNYNNYSTGTQSNWNNWVLAFVNVDNAHRKEQVQGLDDYNSEYAEYFVLRADYYGWGNETDGYWKSTGLSKSWTEDGVPSNFNELMNGATCVCTISRSDSKLKVSVTSTSTSSIELTEAYECELGSDKDCYVFVTVDHCHIELQGEGSEVY